MSSPEPNLFQTLYKCLSVKELGPLLSEIVANTQQNPLALDELLAALTRYSLIQRDVDTRTYSIHRLVQAVVKDGLDGSSQRLWAERTVRLVERSFPFDEAAPWSQSQRYLPHALTCLTTIQHEQMTFDAARHLLRTVGIYFTRRAQYHEAAPLLSHAARLCERVLGPEHPDAAASLISLATLYYAQGDYPRAQPLYERALAICERVLGPQHPDTRKTREDYTRLLMNQATEEDPSS